MKQILEINLLHKQDIITQGQNKFIDSLLLHVRLC